MHHAIVRVVKLGGSLLDIEGLGERLSRWRQLQSGKGHVLVVGGGRVVDAIRDACRTHQVAAGDAHWLAIRAMRLNALRVADLLPGDVPFFWPGIRNPQPQDEAVAILDPWEYLSARVQAGRRPLPETWDVTSDSIAARLAEDIAADELVLLKSALPERHWRRREAAAEGYVDAYFPTAAQRLARVRCVDFRHEGFLERLLPP